MALPWKPWKLPSKRGSIYGSDGKICGSVEASMETSALPSPWKRLRKFLVEDSVEVFMEITVET